jgi:antitoxin FitA
MGQILVRRVGDDLKARLKSRAAQHGVSMEEEVRAILSKELGLKDEAGLGTRIANLFKHFPDNDGPLPEFPKEPFKPWSFDAE